MTDRYGDDVLDQARYRVRIGEKQSIDMEYGKFTIYLSLEEIFRGPKENKEAMIIQHRVAHKLLPELSSINPNFKDALSIQETRVVLSRRKDGRRKVKNYYDRIFEKHRENAEIEIVAALDEEKQLKKVVRELRTEFAKKKWKTGDISISMKQRVRKHIGQKTKSIRSKLLDIQEFDELSDEAIVKRYASRNAFESNRVFTEKQVVESVIKKKPLQYRLGVNLSYSMIAIEVLENRGTLAYRIAKKFGCPQAQLTYGIAALLKHKKGLGLIERKKVGNHFELYPTEKFKKLLVDGGYKFTQKELSDFTK